MNALLTLVATPVAYSLFDDASAWIKAQVARMGRSKETNDSNDPNDYDAAAVTNRSTIPSATPDTLRDPVTA